MKLTSSSISAALRIPGPWAEPEELQERLPDGFRMTPGVLHLPDGQEVDLIPLPPDDQFPQIFASSCRQSPSDDELAILEEFSVNVGLSGPGGSRESARTIMQAAAGLVQAGGAGVFIDNSGVAHGGSLWLELTGADSADALSYAFVGIVRGEREFRTMGMHVLGFPDVVLQQSDTEEDAETIVGIVCYICGSDKPVGDGHVIADECGPRFRATATPPDEQLTGSPMHNPYGRLKLESFKQIAEGN